VHSSNPRYPRFHTFQRNGQVANHIRSVTTPTLPPIPSTKEHNSANFILILAVIIALPIGRASKRNNATFIFATTENLTTWPVGFTWFLAWLSPIWTIGGFDSCVHMSEEASNATKAVPYGILMSIGSCWFFGWIICIVLAACMNPDFEAVLGSAYGTPIAQIFYDAVGKNGALGLLSLVFIVQYFMGLSILVAASRQSWVRLYSHTDHDLGMIR
jgi:amino acid transporter